MPHAFNKVEASSSALQDVAKKGAREDFQTRFMAWLRANWGVLAVNIGSMCTLIGFTRSDVLELRILSVLGSVMGVVYNVSHPQILWPPVLWGCTFLSVNGFKIYQIVQERNADVHMTDQQEDIFVEHFMPHGVTPKQFEKIYRKADKIKFKKNDLIVRAGDKLDRIYLVVSGSTQASILGRHVTAASTTPETKGDQKQGGDSGAWVGEMAFLDSFWEKEQAKMKLTKKKTGQVDKKANTEQPSSAKADLTKAIYTIVTTEDTTVMSWTHDDMAELMNTSGDLRSALTRAMTSALVGKVVNLTISRSNNTLPNWSTWLSEWSRNDGTRVEVKGVHQLPEDKPQETSVNLLSKTEAVDVVNP
jgi:CRP-like cAMP-binding protein